MAATTQMAIPHGTRREEAEPLGAVPKYGLMNIYFCQTEIEYEFLLQEFFNDFKEERKEL